MAERLTPRFLQSLLSASEPTLTVYEVHVNPGSGRGDNYTAMLYRVNVSGYLKQDKNGENTEEVVRWERPLIYKCLPTSAERRQAYRSDVLFSNEVAFYTKALPALLRFQRCRGVPDSQGFSAVPRCYTARQDLLLLEDLRTRGFVMLDRKTGLGEAQCRAVLQELAMFHALSIAMKAQEPQEFVDQVESSVREALFEQDNQEWYRDYYAAACSSALASVRELLLPKYADKFEAFTDGFFSRMTTLLQISRGVTPAGDEVHEQDAEDQLIVLCHGDCWTNNILFRNAENTDEILEVCLLDFQLARVGSPALDLANLLYCCTSRELRRDHLSSLLHHYHEHLGEALFRLGCKRDLVTFEKLNQHMRRFSAFGLGLALDMIPISTCESAEAPDLYSGQGQVQGQDHEGCALLQAPITQEGKQRMADLVQELVDQDLI